jgi:hypothetical protein
MIFSALAAIAEQPCFDFVCDQLLWNFSFVVSGMTLRVSALGASLLSGSNARLLVVDRLVGPIIRIAENVGPVARELLAFTLATGVAKKYSASVVLRLWIFAGAAGAFGAPRH